MEVKQIFLFSCCILLMIEGICCASIEKGLNAKTKKLGNSVAELENFDTNRVNLVRVRRHDTEDDNSIYDGEYEDGEEDEEQEALEKKDANEETAGGVSESESGGEDTDKKKIQPKNEDPFPPDCGFLYKIEEAIKTRQAGDSGTSKLGETFYLLVASFLLSLLLEFS